MKTPAQLLNAYLDNIQNPAAAAALFAEDGVLELPSLGPNVRAVGPLAIEAFIGGLLKNVPDFRFHDVQLFIETADQAFGEYSVEAKVLSTGKLYQQTYAGRLVAKDGKITLLREALDTLAAAKAFSPD
ncbi:nuclear transport factor 2 family protein [Duganella sp. sic0402]|uniref:nuclear transport factor 2 family protein n=1 Tax=Duganella sp. sic0402 TaxID=2854786 RepID=UPI001C4914EF|nr:nuclear transport factor 2 family protein [Duganella sp. sic0402]MBV7535888.1 nuclear transport factor 2 family protein [Duganella sp. sic0402]